MKTKRFYGAKKKYILNMKVPFTAMDIDIDNLEGTKTYLNQLVREGFLIKLNYNSPILYLCKS